MTDSIAFITTMSIEQGHLEEFKAAVARSLAFLEANGPQVMASVYIDEEQMVAHGLQIHRDSASILRHWQLADPHMRDVMQHTTTNRVEIYGLPDEAVRSGMERLASAGASIIIRPPLAGFDRFPDTTSA